MGKQPSRLSFSKEELEAEGQKPLKEQPPQPKGNASKADRDKAPKNKASEQTGKAQMPKEKAKRQKAQRLFFEEVQPKTVAQTPKKPSTLPLPLKAAGLGVHTALDKQEENNTGLEAAHSTQRTATSTLRSLRQGQRHRQLKANRNSPTQAAEPKTNKTAPGMPSSPQTQDGPVFASNPISRWQQRKAIKKQYIASRKAAAGQVSMGKGLVQKTKDRMKQGTALLRRKKRSTLLVGVFVGLLLLVMNSLSSCSVLLESTLTSVASATYPSQDSDMRAAEAMYRQMEEELQYELDNYQMLHPEYDEVSIDSDKLEHDPYVLLSLLTALKRGKAWTIDEVAGTLQTIFEKQYIRTETVTTETRYRSEWQTGLRYVADPQTGQLRPEYYQYEASVPYHYRKVHVKIKNFNMSHLPVYMMSHQQMGLYAMYMSQVGNRPDLFPGSPYIHKYLVEEYPKYEPPPEDLSDPTFAAIMEEAVKYLGFPYVWGGASPTTSFDCSGFVSWVYNQSGWNIGRLGSQGLYDHSRVIQAEEVRPGDLIFFTKTFEADNDVTHVGIMVNQNTMLHCGDPIQYTRIDDAYHIEHFYAYGRIPK